MYKDMLLEPVMLFLSCQKSKVTPETNWRLSSLWRLTDNQEREK